MWYNIYICSIKAKLILNLLLDCPYGSNSMYTVVLMILRRFYNQKLIFIPMGKFYIYSESRVKMEIFKYWHPTPLQVAVRSKRCTEKECNECNIIGVSWRNKTNSESACSYDRWNTFLRNMNKGEGKGAENQGCQNYNKLCFKFNYLPFNISRFK